LGSTNNRFLINRKSSDGQVETAPCKPLIGQDNFYVVFLGLTILLRLLLSLLGREKLQLVVLQLLLQSFQLYLVLKYGLLVIVYLFPHRFYLLLLLLQSLLVGRDHPFFFHRRLPLQHLLQRLQFLFFLLQILLSPSHFLSFYDESLLDGLNFCHQIKGGGFSGLKFPPTMNVHGLLNLFRERFDLQLTLSILASQIMDFRLEV
jgi:hypothetical protein